MFDIINFLVDRSLDGMLHRIYELFVEIWKLLYIFYGLYLFRKYPFTEHIINSITINTIFILHSLVTKHNGRLLLWYRAIKISRNVVCKTC